jgi:5-formyltetrahydrofolate cyclo-ligase
MEPKDNCPKTDVVEVVLVPTVGITKAGVRLGYGFGFYDRFLATSEAKTISLTYSKQIVKSIPISEKDVKIDWIVTEDEVIETSKTG